MKATTIAGGERDRPDDQRPDDVVAVRACVSHVPSLPAPSFGCVPLDLLVRVRRLALLGELPRLLDPAFAAHAAVEALEVAVDPGDLLRASRPRSGGSGRSRAGAAALQLRPDPLDQLEVVRPARPRRREPLGRCSSTAGPGSLVSLASIRGRFCAPASAVRGAGSSPVIRFTVSPSRSAQRHRGVRRAHPLAPRSARSARRSARRRSGRPAAPAAAPRRARSASRIASNLSAVRSS